SQALVRVRVGTHLVLHFWKPDVEFVKYFHGERLEPFRDVPKSAFGFSLPVTVVGIVTSPGDFPQQGPFGAVTLTPAFFRRYADRTASNTMLEAKLRRGSADLPAFTREVEALAGGGTPQMSSVEDTVGQLQSSIHPQAIALWLFAALALVAGVLAFGQAL